MAVLIDWSAPPPRASLLDLIEVGRPPLGTELTAPTTV